MTDFEMLQFVARLQIASDLIVSGQVGRAIEEIERRKRLGNLPLMGDAAYLKFIALCRDLHALKPQIESIAEDGKRFEQLMKSGSGGMN